MGWLLDTNIWILHLKNPGGPIEQRLNRLQPADIFLCSVVKAELWHGAHKYGNFERRRNALGNMFARFVSLPFDDAAAQDYGEIRHGLEIRGETIGPNDLKIAAICVSNGLTLVSGNILEFGRIEGLAVEDWTLA
ncbi:MAG: type II toxin-antitoxin system VapC family toxin [Verrucomicrobia bacterium]|nr:type II toxin-antitoxin system VapC family toxin [Verrucomicrobiota bacterium]